MVNFPLPRLDKDEKLQKYLLEFCRLQPGDEWVDPLGKHKVGCVDAANERDIKDFMGRKRAALAIHDPPYNMVAFKQMKDSDFIEWCRRWVGYTFELMKEDASFYVWLGADQSKNFEPFPKFILMMNDSGFRSKSFITMRNQRGYGTQKNWMAVRQELLYYVKGSPVFNITAEYTDIKKVTGGYYKTVKGELTDNFERSKSDTIRAGNVWTDIQQVFHLREENVNGCYAQKPLKSCERIIEASSKKNDLVVDFFAHSGTALIASELLKRKCYTVDINPIYCEISIRRLERLRETGKVGWQNSNPFEREIMSNKKILNYLKKEYNIMPSGIV